MLNDIEGDCFQQFIISYVEMGLITKIYGFSYCMGSESETPTSKFTPHSDFE